MTDSPKTGSPSTGKGHATPSRREREAANKRPLVAGKARLTKEEKRKRANARFEARQGFEAGDERYLPARDKGPQKRFVRDYVDARLTVAEFMVPLMFAVIVLTFLPQYSAKDQSGAVMQLTVLIAMYGFFLIALIDVMIMGRSITRAVAAKFGADRVEKGLRWYAGVRAFQFRPLRTPKPRVERGQFPS